MYFENNPAFLQRKLAMYHPCTSVSCRHGQQLLKAGSPHSVHGGISGIKQGYDTIRYNTIRYNTIRYDTVQCDTIRYDTIRYNIIQYGTMRYNTVQYNMI